MDSHKVHVKRQSTLLQFSVNGSVKSLQNVIPKLTFLSLFEFTA